MLRTSDDSQTPFLTSPQNAPGKALGGGKIVAGTKPRPGTSSQMIRKPASPNAESATVFVLVTASAAAR